MLTLECLWQDSILWGSGTERTGGADCGGIEADAGVSLGATLVSTGSGNVIVEWLTVQSCTRGGCCGNCCSTSGGGGWGGDGFLTGRTKVSSNGRTKWGTVDWGAANATGAFLAGTNKSVLSLVYTGLKMLYAFPIREQIEILITMTMNDFK